MGAPATFSLSNVCLCVCVSWCLPVTCQYLPVTVVNTTAQLTALRQQMHTQNLSAYIVPDTDAHMVRDGSSHQPPTPSPPRAGSGLREQATNRTLLRMEDGRQKKDLTVKGKEVGSLDTGVLGPLKECIPLHRREDIAKSP